MMNFTKEQLSAVTDFTIGHDKFEMVVWDGTVDVRGLDIDKIVSISKHNITVYPNKREKHELGQGRLHLHCLSESNMLGVAPCMPDRTH